MAEVGAKEERKDLYTVQMQQKAEGLYEKISILLEEARTKVFSTVNTTMVRTYYEIGKIIVEEEQEGKERAEYGKKTLKHLSDRLIERFGKGFTVRYLEQMRMFYLTYSKSKTLFSQSQGILS